MEEFLVNFHFLRPWILMLLVFPLLLYGFYFRGITSQSSWQKVIDKKLLEFLLVKGSAVKRRVFIWTALFGILITIIAAAGPSWQKVEIPALEPENPVVIILNLSSDIEEKDLKPSRLDRAKYKITDFLSMLKGVQVGLEVYSSEPFVVAPFTDDMNILLNLLPVINTSIMPSNGDRLDRAIDLAVQRLKDTGYTKGHLVIFTPDVGQKFDLALSSAKSAFSSGFIIDIIGVSSVANDKLAMIAKNGGGDYWNVQTDDVKISSLANKINQYSSNIKQSENKRTDWLDYGYLIIPLAMFCCLMFFRKGLLVVVFILMSSNAFAGFFLNSNQEGLRSFNNGDFVRAASTFKDNRWKGASLYRAGDFQNAFIEYEKDMTTEGIYNQGNALAKSGKIKEAISKYEEVLKLAPNHEDAKFNLEYLKQQQKNQQQQNHSQNNNDNKNQNQQQQQNQNQKQDDSQADNSNQQQQQDNPEKENSEQRQNQQGQHQEDGKQDKNSNKQDEQANQQQNNTINELEENKQQLDGKQNSGAINKSGSKDEKYDEKMQAKLQQYREVPEDPGGLLKAFIYQEYSQNRYNEK